MTKKTFYQIIVFVTALIFSISFLITPINTNAAVNANVGKEQTSKQTDKENNEQNTTNTDSCKAKFKNGLVQYDGSCDKENGIEAFLNMLTRIAGFVMKIALLVAVIMIIYAGFQLLTSNGNAAKKNEVKDLLINIAVGIILIGSA